MEGILGVKDMTLILYKNLQSIHKFNIITLEFTNILTSITDCFLLWIFFTFQIKNGKMHLTIT